MDLIFYSLTPMQTYPFVDQNND